MRVTKLLVASILLFMVGSTEGRTTPTQHAPRPLSAADVEHGLKAAGPNAHMAALGKQYGVDFEVTHTVEDELRSAGASDNLILQIRRSRSRAVGKPVRPAGHTVVDRAHGPANTTRAHAETSAKEFLSQADKYRVGSGVVRNEGKAAELYRKAADMGNAEAQTRFAEALFDGRGVARDPAGSRAWLEKASRQGNARAECDLGVMLTNGLDIARSCAISKPLVSITPRSHSARALPCRDAFSSHARDPAGSRATPRPSNRASANLVCASALPMSAALRYNSAALPSFRTTPEPTRYLSAWERNSFADVSACARVVFAGPWARSTTVCPSGLTCLPAARVRERLIWRIRLSLAPALRCSSSTVWVNSKSTPYCFTSAAMRAFGTADLRPCSTSAAERGRGACCVRVVRPSVLPTMNSNMLATSSFVTRIVYLRLAMISFSACIARRARPRQAFAALLFPSTCNARL